MFIVNKSELEKIIDFPSALEEIKKSFIAFSEKKVLAPPPFFFYLPEENGEICLKTALIEGLPTYTVKIVSVFKSNEKIGLPTLTGTMIVFNSKTGKLLAVLNEDGWLTNLRTACAGALVDRSFRQNSARNLGVIGAGNQAEWQTRLVLGQNKGYQTVYAFDINQKKIQQYIDRMRSLFPTVSFVISASIGQLVEAADTIFTVTPAIEPLILPEMVKKGVTIIGIGADMPQKCEISPDLYAKADKIFVDSLESNLLLGGISRSIDQKKISSENINSEIGDVFAGKKEGRANDKEIIIVNLVGIGSQDTFIGNLVYQKCKVSKMRYIGNTYLTLIKR